MKLRAENNTTSITLTAVQWSYIAGLLRIYDANFLPSGVIKTEDFPEARRQLMYALNSSLMLHFARLSFPDAETIMRELLEFITECRATDCPIIWDTAVPSDPEKFQMSAGSYVVGDLRNILNVTICDSQLVEPLVLMLDDAFAYSFPVKPAVYSDSEGRLIPIRSSFAVVPKHLAKPNHYGLELEVSDDFCMWLDSRNRLNFYDVFFDLNYRETMEVLC